VWAPNILPTAGGTADSSTAFDAATSPVEHGGEYALVASVGGAPENPTWYYNIAADPTALMIQDGAEAHDYVAREVEGDERALWWERAVAAYPSYADYQANTERRIPVFVASRVGA